MMATVLMYTSPARGHLFPILGVANALRERGHDVHLRTLAAEVERVRELGFGVAPIAAEIEALQMNDWRAGNPIQAQKLAVKTFTERATHEVGDLQAAIAAVVPDLLVVDCNSWGAQAAAEESGLPWCSFQPYLTPLPSRDAPPFGPGLAPARGPLGRLRDAVLGALLYGMFSRMALPGVNALRRGLGLAEHRSMRELFTAAPRTLYFTAEPLEYPRRDWPPSYHMVGPATWGPSGEPPSWLEAIDRPIVLVTCSTEFQDDGEILATALAAFEDEDVFVVGTAAATDLTELDIPANARVETFVPHDPLLERAAAVVCHGGMGITQRALARGVPVCVVPFGRDQLEVAQHVDQAGVGARLPRKGLTPERLKAAVRRTMERREAAQRCAEAFARAGGTFAAADVVEDLLPAQNAPSEPQPDAEPVPVPAQPGRTSEPAVAIGA